MSSIIYTERIVRLIEASDAAVEFAEALDASGELTEISRSSSHVLVLWLIHPVHPMPTRSKNH